MAKKTAKIPAITLDDLSERPAPTPAQMAKVIELARLQFKLERELAEAIAVVKKMSDRLDKVAIEDLPQAMSAAGIESQTLTGGYTLSVTRELRASLTKGKLEEGIDWLEENGHGDLVKHEIWMQFGRAEEKKAKAVVKYLKQRKYAAARVQDARTVHASTLSAFVREQIREGNAVPMDLLGVFDQRRAVITPPKQEKL